LFLKIGVMVSWKINQNEISKNLCVNRLRPEKQCHGHCQLEKEIKKVESPVDNSKSTTLPLKIKPFFGDDLINGFGKLSFMGLPSSVLVQYYKRHDNYNYQFLCSCFHPPPVKV
jgi:hypothetical protein